MPAKSGYILLASAPLGVFHVKGHMKKFCFNASVFVLLLSMLGERTYAATGVKELIENYQYAVTVEWDQKDESFLAIQNETFKSGVQQLILSEQSSEQIMNETLNMIKDEKMKAELTESINLLKNNQTSADQVLQVLENHSSQMQEQGTSWSPAVKIIVGVLAGYVLLKLAFLAIYYADTDPNYGQTTDSPPKP